MPRERGQCSVCQYHYPLRKDGTLGSHHGYYGHERAPECKGTGQPPLFADTLRRVKLRQVNEAEDVW
jgi:hypothetical protein